MPDLSLRITHNLTFKQRFRLVAALLECPSVKDEPTRKSIINDLRPEISNKIPHDSRAERHVGGMVRTALNYPGGIEELLEIVRYYESGSIAAQSLREAELEVFAPPPLAEPLLTALRELLKNLPLPPADLNRLYRWCLPPNAVTTGPVIAYQAVLELFQFEMGGPACALEFVERLAGEPALTMQSTALSQWLDAAAAKLAIARPQIRHRIQQTAAAARAPVYLMIQLTPTSLRKTETFTLQAWRWRSQHEIEPLPFKCRSHAAPEECENQPHPLADAEEIVQQIVTREGDSGQNFTLELIAPRELFSHGLTRWKIAIGEAVVSLVTQQAIVLRWLNRITHPELQGRWRSRWQDARGAEHLHTDALVCCIAPDYTTKKLLAKLAQANNAICVGLGFAPPAQAGPGDLLTNVLSFGTPIVIWFEQIQAGQKVDEQKIKELLGQRPLSELPQLVWELRNQAAVNPAPDQPGSYLTLLYDNFDRLPPTLAGGAPPAIGPQT